MLHQPSPSIHFSPTTTMHFFSHNPAPSPALPATSPLPLMSGNPVPAAPKTTGLVKSRALSSAEGTDELGKSQEPTAVFPLFRPPSEHDWSMYLLPSRGDDSFEDFHNKMLPAFFKAHRAACTGNFDVFLKKESRLRYQDHLLLTSSKKTFRYITTTESGCRALMSILDNWHKKHEKRANLAKRDLEGNHYVVCFIGLLSGARWVLGVSVWCAESCWLHSILVAALSKINSRIANLKSRSSALVDPEMQHQLKKKHMTEVGTYLTLTTTQLLQVCTRGLSCCLFGMEAAPPTIYLNNHLLFF